MKVVAIICLGLFVYIFFRQGPKAIWGLLKDIAWYNWMILFFLRFMSLNLRTVNWRLVCKKYDMHIPYWTLLKARLAGLAVGFLSPQPKIAAEAVRALMIENVSQKKVFASVVVDKTIELIATIGLVVLGIIIAIFILDMPNELKLMFIMLTIFLVFLISFFYLKQRKGFFIWMLDLMKKFRIKSKRLENQRDKIQDVDVHISDFYLQNKKTFTKVFLLYIVKFFLWGFEYHVSMLSVGVNGITFLDSFLVLALSHLSFVLPAAPSSLGIYEITLMSIFKILSIHASLGIAFILVRRVLGLIIAGIGIFPILKRKSLPELRKKAASVPSKEK